MTAFVLTAFVTLGACSDTKGAPVLDLADKGPGTCLVAGADIGPQVTGIPTVDCTKEHTHELYAVIPYDKPDVFPGLAALDTYAQRVCVGAFESYVGVSPFDSTLSFSWLTPTLTSWNNNKDHDILCVVGPFDGSTMTASVKGSGR